jgi:rod shape-determining protein MreD
MRWPVLLVVAYLLLLVQATLGRALTIESAWPGPIGPDLAALLAVYLVLHVRADVDALLSACLLGWLVDLTTAGGAGDLTVAGPMALGYALGAFVLLQLREGVFRERAVPQILLALLFVVLAHGLWIVLQSILGRAEMSWGDVGRLLIQALGSAVYTAVLMPVLHVVFSAIRSWLLTSAPSGRRRRV